MLQDVYYWNDPVQVFPWREIFWVDGQCTFVAMPARIWFVATFLFVWKSGKLKAFVHWAQKRKVRKLTRKKQNPNRKKQENKQKAKQSQKRREHMHNTRLHWVTSCKAPLAHATCWRMVNWDAFTAQWNFVTTRHLLEIRTRLTWQFL